MPFSLPAQSTAKDPPAAAAVATPHALLLLPQRPPTPEIRALLMTRLLANHVACTGHLSEAMVAISPTPPALAVLDAALCDALEREFVDHLLQLSPEALVMLTGTEGRDWPAHPRVVHLPAPGLLPAVQHWLAAQPQLTPGLEPSEPAA